MIFLLNHNLPESDRVSGLMKSGVSLDDEPPTKSHKMPILGIILHISVSETWMAEVMPMRVPKKVAHASSMLPSQCSGFTVFLPRFMHCSPMPSVLGPLKSGGFYKMMRS